MVLRGARLVVAFLTLVFCSTVLLANPAKSHASSWEQVGVDGLGAGATNITSVRIVEFNDNLYVSTGGISGARIYRSSDGQTWTQVNTAGFGVPGNIDSILKVHGSALYAGTDSVGGSAQLWKTTDGTTWTQIGTDGFGDASNIGVAGMSDFNGHLYIGTSRLLGAQIFRLDDTTLVPVVSNGFDGNSQEVWALQEYNGALYAGTFSTGGAQIWKSSDGTTWVPVMQGGFGDVNNQRINTLFVFNGKLYAGTLNNGNATGTGTEVWRTMTDDSNWEQVNIDGFGKATETWTGDSVAIINGTIYLGTRNNTDGARLFTSTDGSTWTQEGTTGFGDTNNCAIYAITFNGRVYVDFSNFVTGAEIWRTETMGVLSISTTSMPEGTVGNSYSKTIEVTNGTSPKSYSVSGSLPDGLSLNYSTAEISGTPTKEGTFTFTVSVVDAGSPQQMASRELSIKVNAAAATPVPTLPETGASQYFFLANYLI